MSICKNLIFDLDRTLYPLSFNTEPFFDERCQKYLEIKLQLSGIDAVRVQKIWREKYHYLADAVQKECGFSVDDFMEYICDIDMTGLPEDIELNQLLQKLNYKKYIFTDSTVKHTIDTLALLKVSPKVFEKIYVAKDNDYIFKYNVNAFDKMLLSCGLKAEESLMFEDNKINVQIAKQQGMRTVWINDGFEDLSEADYKFPDIKTALKTLF